MWAKITILLSITIVCLISSQPLMIIVSFLLFIFHVYFYCYYHWFIVSCALTVRILVSVTFFVIMAILPKP